MVAHPIWIAGYGDQPANVPPVWITSYGRPPASVTAAEVSIIGYGGRPQPGTTSVRIVSYGAPPPTGATAIWISCFCTVMPVPPSNWSTADATTNAMTLINNNMTVASPLGGWRSIRSTVGKTFGKLYVEFLAAAITTANNIYIGLADATFNPVGPFPVGFNPISCAIQPGDAAHWSPTTTFHINYQPTPGVVALPDDVWAIAVDFNNGFIWMARNNVWMEGSDPGSGMLPMVDFSTALSGALFPTLGLNGPTSGNWTLQSSSASQRYTTPPGFLAWDG